MVAKLIMLYKDCPRRHSHLALIRHEDKDKVTYTTEIMTGWEAKTILLVQCLRPQIIAEFSNRKTEMQKFEMVDKTPDNTARSFENSNRDSLYYSTNSNIYVMAVIGNQPIIALRPSGVASLSTHSRVYNGWLVRADSPYFSTNELMTNTGQSNVPVYKIELQPKTLVTFNTSITDLVFYHCNLLNSRDFSAGIELFVRNNNGLFDEKGADPTPNVFKEVPDRLLNRLNSLGITTV